MPLRERVPFMRRHYELCIVTQNEATAKRCLPLAKGFLPLTLGVPQCFQMQFSLL